MKPTSGLVLSTNQPSCTEKYAAYSSLDEGCWVAASRIAAYLFARSSARGEAAACAAEGRAHGEEEGDGGADGEPVGVALCCQRDSRQGDETRLESPHDEMEATS